MRKEDTSYWIMADGAMWALPMRDRSEAEDEVRRLRAAYPGKRWTLQVTHSVRAEAEVSDGA